VTNKYNNKKVTIDGIEFDSKIEARYYEHLKELEKQGVVSEFLLQKKYLLLEGFDKNGKRIRPIHYIADFEVHYADGTIEVVDIKGFETPDFRIKKKLFEYRYPFELKLITYSKIDGGWIELEDLKKARRERKKQH
jgi:hypothetical protein